jgi:uncharacterized membrane protein YkoI
MMKKLIVALVVLVAVIGLAFATLDNNEKQENTNNNTTQLKQENLTHNTTPINSNNKNISSAEAKKIANTYIDSQGASAGTPNLVKQDGKYVYIVPVMDNGKNVGEIYIDAETGENLGGAGGSP